MLHVPTHNANFDFIVYVDQPNWRIERSQNCEGYYMEPVGQTVENIAQCMSLCVSVPGCAAVVFVEMQKKCYPKHVCEPNLKEDLHPALFVTALFGLS